VAVHLPDFSAALTFRFALCNSLIGRPTPD
jgi:hypothetical protein